MANCPYCATEISVDINFCENCEKQVCCLHCESLLHKGKSICLKCGEPLKRGVASESEMNSYTLDEKSDKDSYSRRIELRASNEAVGSFVGKLPLGPRASPQRPPEDKNNIPIDQVPELPSSSSNSIDVEPNGQATIRSDSKAQEGNSSELGRLFTEHSKYEIIPSKSLRTYIHSLSSKKNKQQTFAIIFVWAFKKMLNKSISRDELVSVMKHETLHDTNSAGHISETAKNYFKEDDNHYEVNDYDGAEKVEEIIDAIRNP